MLTPPHEPAALAAAMERLLREPGLAGRLSAKARESAVVKFSVGKTTRELQHLLVRRGGIDPPEEARRIDPALPRPTLLARLLQRVF